MSSSGSAGSAGEWSADEIRGLLTSVTEWAQRAFPAPPSGHGGPECQWCPLCQIASVLRGEHPELLDRFAEAGTAVAGALRALGVTTPERSSADSAPRSEDPRDDTGLTRERPRPRPRPRVEPAAPDETSGTG